MPSLKDRFRDVDLIDPPDVWQRALEQEPSALVATHEPRRHRLATMAVAWVIAVAAIAVAVRAFSGGTSTPGAATTIPADPCGLVTTAQVEEATGGRVTATRRLDRSDYMVPPPSGSELPCEFVTDSRFGAIIVSTGIDDTTAFQTVLSQDRQNVTAIDTLGDQAFADGKASVWVRIGDSYFSLGAQRSAGDGAIAMLSQLARTALGSANVSSPIADPLSTITQGWTQLPLPPEPASQAASVWTGTQLIVWGGYVPDAATHTERYLSTGSAFDPSSDTWTAIPPAPRGRADAIALWTGTEALFLFGHDASEGFVDGFAFDPSTDSWRTIAASPMDPYVETAVWTGSGVIAWGSGRSRGGTNSGEGASYDPATDTWQRIANAPVSLNAASSVWTGNEMIVFGSRLDSGNHATTDTAIGASYDPATNNWTALPPSALSPQATSTAWTGDRLLAWDYITHSQTFDPDTQTWAPSIKMPLEPSECYPDSAPLSGSVFAFYCGDAALYDDTSDTWERLHGGMLDATVESHGTPIKLWRFANMTPAGDVVFIQAEGITISNKGAPCYGCSSSPSSFWVYRP